VRYYDWRYNGERLKITKTSKNPKILLPETKYNGSGETIHKLQKCKNKEEYEILCEKQRKNMRFSLFLGFYHSKVLNLFGRFLIRGFAVGRREHRRV
jgi:hypothetical protein